MRFTTTGRAGLALACALVLGACAGQQTQYAWAGYDYALLKHYKDATSNEELADALGQIVEKSEKKGHVPPGLYADYAYALYAAGRGDQALVYFRKERDAWPEAAPFMNDVIARIEGKPVAADAADAAGSR
ncbi:MAG: DUF4810 domain-containing protein [Alphaproteobacteria bacterium]|nr:MAG: DUF4810 domain-containing protein [Alphaproteobacteria bacterium]